MEPPTPLRHIQSLIRNGMLSRCGSGSPYGTELHPLRRARIEDAACDIEVRHRHRRKAAAHDESRPEETRQRSYARTHGDEPVVTARPGRFARFCREFLAYLGQSPNNDVI